MAAKSIVCVVVAGVMSGSYGMMGDTSAVISPGAIRRLLDFGYEAGGTVNATYTLQTDPASESGNFIIAALCTDTQVSDLLQYYSNPYHSLCHMPASSICWQAERLAGAGGWYNTSNLVWSIPPTPAPEGDLSFVLVSCFRSNQATVDLQYVCLNAGGEQLSSGQIPLKGLSITFTVAWVLLTVSTLCASVVAYYNYVPPGRGEVADEEVMAALSSPIRPVHVALLACAVLLSVSAGYSWSMWYAISSSGTEYLDQAVADTVLWDVASAAVVALLLALSRGWNVTRLTLDTAEMRAVAALTLLYSCAWAVWQWINGFAAMFVLVTTYVLILRYLFFSITSSLRILAVFRVYSASLLAAAVRRRDAEEEHTAASQALLGTTTQSSSRGGAREGYGPQGVETHSVPVRAPLPESALHISPETARMLAAPAYGGMYAAPGKMAGGEGTKSGRGRKAYGSMTGEGDWDEEHSPRAEHTGTGGSSLRPSSSAGWTVLQNARSAALMAARASMTVVDAITAPRRGQAQSEDETAASGTSAAGRAAGGVEEDSPVEEGGLTLRQMAFLRVLRSSVLVYLSLDVFLNVWATMDFSSAPWVSFSLEHGLVGGILLFLSFALRPRSSRGTSPLFDPAGYLVASEDVLTPLVGRGVGMASGTTSSSHSASRVPSDTPRWLVLVGPDGQIRGAAGKEDDGGRTQPQLPMLSPAEFASLAREDELALHASTWSGRLG